MARRTTTVSSKHQLTIPADAFSEAGLRVGDRIEAHADGPGRVVLLRVEDPVEKFAGALTGAFEAAGIDELRSGWD